MLSQYHKIISGIIAVAFVVVVQVFSIPFPIFRHLIPIVIACVFGVQLYNYFYLRELGKSPIWPLIRLSLFFVAWFGLFALLPTSFLRGIFLLASMVCIYIFERVLGNFGEHIVLNEVLLIAWGIFLVAMGMSFYFAGATSYIVGLQFVAMLLLVRSSLSFVPYGETVKWVGALAIALFTTELAWILNFLPFHYSALAMMLFALFYVCYALYFYALFNTLTWKRAQFHIGLAGLLAGIIMAVTPWRIIG